MLIIAVIIAAGVYAGYTVTTNSQLCGQCHEMRPEFYTWQDSSHSQIKCVDCHLPTNRWQRVVRNFLGIRMVVEHFTHTVPENITIRQAVTNDNCLVCHTLNRQATLPGDLRMSHVQHIDHGVLCVNCHNGVVHGKIVERGQIDKVPRENWNASMGKTQLLLTNTQPRMILCLQCHLQWKVSTQCERCHSKIPTPPSHQPGTWLTLHGQEAWKDVNHCSQCHWEKGIDNKFDKNAVAQYIRANNFCYSCHLRYRPPSHTESWAHDHASRVVKGEIPYCVVCHDISPPENATLGSGNGVYCNQCHGKFFVEGRPVPKLDDYFSVTSNGTIVTANSVTPK